MDLQINKEKKVEYMKWTDEGNLKIRTDRRRNKKYK